MKIHALLDGMSQTLHSAPSHVVAGYRLERYSVSRRWLMEAIISSLWPTLPALNLHHELSSSAMLLIVPQNGRPPHGLRYAMQNMLLNNYCKCITLHSAHKSVDPASATGKSVASNSFLSDN